MVNFSMMFHALSYREIYLFHFNTVLGPFGRCFHFHIMYVQYVSLSNIFILTLPSLHQSICDTLHYFCVKYLCGIFLAGWFEKFLKEKKKRMSEQSFNNKWRSHRAGVLSLFDIPSKPIYKICRLRTWLLISSNLEDTGDAENAENITRLSNLMILFL